MHHLRLVSGAFFCENGANEAYEPYGPNGAAYDAALSAFKFSP